MLTHALLLALSLLLGACSTSVYNPGEPYHLADISVSATRESTGSPRLVALVQQDLDLIAAARPNLGTARVLDVMITEYHKKHPFRSLMIGDENRIGAKARILMPDSEIVEWEEDFWLVDTAFIDGILGAMVAAGQDAAVVETRLARVLSGKIAGAAYGSEKPLPVPEAVPAQPPPAEEIPPPPPGEAPGVPTV